MAKETERKSGNAVRPLIVRFGALGDMVLLTVLIRTLARRFRSPVDLVSSGGWTRPLFVGHPDVADIHTIRSRRTPYWASGEQHSLVAALRARPNGPTWYCDSDDVGRRLLRRAGIPAGLIVEARTTPVREDEHFADYWHRIAELTPADAVVPHNDEPPSVTERLPVLPVTDSEREALARWLTEKSIAGRDLILIQVGNKRTMRSHLSPGRASNTKFWPIEHWVSVLAALQRQHPSAAILLLGVDAEKKLNDEICARAGLSAVMNVAGDVPVPRLVTLASAAIGMVSVDTGPAHCAAAAGGRVVVLFGRARPVNYAPRGEGARVSCLTGNHNGAASILGIRPEQVIGAWNEVIGI